MIDEPEGELALNCLIIYGNNRSLTLAASTPDEKEKWKLDFLNAIQLAKTKSDTKTIYLSLKSCSELSKINREICVLFLPRNFEIVCDRYCRNLYYRSPGFEITFTIFSKQALPMNISTNA